MSMERSNEKFQSLNCVLLCPWSATTRNFNLLTSLVPVERNNENFNLLDGFCYAHEVQQREIAIF